jgi:lysophospholipase L1-like esterase
MAKRCRELGVKLVLFTAPFNPRVSLYRNGEDKASYEDFIRSVADRYDLPLYRFDDLVPAEDWGRLLNGPDPLHMGRHGHQIVAGKMIQVVKETLPGE